MLAASPRRFDFAGCVPGLAKGCCKRPDSFGALISHRLRIHEKAQGTMVSLGSRVPEAECNSAFRPLLQQALAGCKPAKNT